jgi:hypothetical protein
VRTVLQVAGLGVIVGLSSAGCVDTRSDEARDHMLMLLQVRGKLADEEMDALAGYGHDALPAIEEGLATGPPPVVRLELVELVGRIGDLEGVPLLEMEVAYGPEPDSRALAQKTLETWATGDDDRARLSTQAIARAAELRAMEPPPPAAE